MSRRYTPLQSTFFEGDAEEVAQDLLGHSLVSITDGARCVGRIVETEAYPGPHDPASHAAASIGRTARNDPMFGRPATAYIHLNYGIHWCLNVVTGAEGFPAAVLIRSLEPLEGLAEMRRRWGGAGAGAGAGRPDRDLCSGPAKLTQALGIGPAMQRHRLNEPPLFIARGKQVPGDAVVRATRVGISRGAEKELRFYDGRSPCVSRKAL